MKKYVENKYEEIYVGNMWKIYENGKNLKLSPSKSAISLSIGDGIQNILISSPSSDTALVGEVLHL